MNKSIPIHWAAVLLRARMTQAQGMGEPVVLQTNPSLVGRWRLHGQDVGGAVVTKPDLT